MNTPNSLGAALAESCQHHEAKIALKNKVNGIYQGITYREFGNSAFALAARLLDQGIKKGDKVSILSNNRPEWAIVDFACQLIGAVLVPIYPSLSHIQVQYILKDSGATILFAENTSQAQKARALIEKKTLNRILIFDHQNSGHRKEEQFSSFIGETEKDTSQIKETVNQHLQRVTRDDLATLIYTSGTTGRPKGVMLTHGNLLSNRESASQLIVVDKEDTVLSLLPLAHVFERLAGHFLVLINGAAIAYAESPLTVAQNLLEVKPTIMIAVPRFYEKMRDRILEAVKNGSPIKRKIFQWAINTGKRAARKSSTSGLRYRMADKLVFSKLKEKTGGNLRFFVSGGAPLPLDLGEFFQAAGITILEGYGMTESSPIIAVNDLKAVRFGTVGFPVPGVEVKIAEDGEILARGPNVMKGYYNLPADTKATLRSDGFLVTGDIGKFDESGRLVITGRKKEIMVTSSGRNVAPAPIENSIKSSSYISEIMLIGDGHQFITALIVPNFEQIKAEGIGEEDNGSDHEVIIKNKQVIALIEYEISRLTAGFSSYEQIVNFRLLPREFSIEDGELTPTMKVRRAVVLEKYAKLIEEMYRESARKTDPNCCN